MLVLGTLVGYFVITLVLLNERARNTPISYFGGKFKNLI